LHSLHSLVSAPCGQKFRPSVRKRESIGAAWARLSLLAQSGPDLSLTDHLLLQHLYMGLSKEAAYYLDATAGGSFSHNTLAEGREILNKFMEKTSFVIGPETQGPQRAHFSLIGLRLHLEQAPISMRRQLHLGHLSPRLQLTTQSG
jgi:hypothetical protein